MHFDEVNGDADGICSIVQLRLAQARESVFVTGAKRDIALLDRVRARPGDTITVLDVSADTNRAALDRLVHEGAAVEYFDHHHAGDAPLPPGVLAHIDPSPDVCTGILVDRHLRGRERIWAVVAAFGDNLLDAACDLAAPLAINAGALEALSDLGQALTHNSYSEHVEDALVAPAELARILIARADPLRFVATSGLYAAMDAARRRDIALARDIEPAQSLPGALVYVMPDAPWARRVRGIFGNEVAYAHPARAHAVATVREDGDYTVSVRARFAHPFGADALCGEFGGNGRAAAAGIERLARERFPEFVARLAEAYDESRCSWPSR
jgi:hypothetical protein